MVETTIPTKVPPCAERLLTRPAWFLDPGVVARAKLTKAKWYARFLSSEFFAKRQVAAITLGHTIHFRDESFYNPHSIQGLSLLAHEIKHIEQYEKLGILKFIGRYVRDYFSHGYGDSISFEGEAYAFEKEVRRHFLKEFRQNEDISSCLDMNDPHRPNINFILMDAA